MQTDLNAAMSEARATAEKHFPQFVDFLETQNKIITSGACLLTGRSAQEDYEQFLRLVTHVEQIWEAACVLFRAKIWPQSLFLAILCLEETGKTGVSRFQLALRQTRREMGLSNESPEKVSRKGSPFFSHSQKHLLAAGAGAIVNTRLHRIVGFAALSQFLEDVRNGGVEHLRQSTLYASLGEAGPLIPCERLVDHQAQFYIVLAGELMAEILGFEPKEWERMLKKVQAFEREIGHPWE